MRIAQIITRRQLRGAEVFAGQLATRLERRGHAAFVVALHPPAEPPLTVDCCEVIDLDGGTGRRLDPLLLRRLVAALDRLRPHVVQANGSDTLKYSALARRWPRTSYALVYRNVSFASRWIGGFVQRSAYRWLLRAVDHVAAVSSGAAEDFRSTYGTDPARITALPIGTPLAGQPDRREARARLRALAGADDDEALLLYIGAFTDEKNQLQIVRAFRTVADAARTPCRLILIGDGPLQQRVREEVAALGLERRVSLAGARADASELMAGADLLLLFSSIEGLPGVLLEAGARGVAAVCSDVGSISEVVEHERTGLLVPAGDVGAFAQAVLSLVEEPSRRCEMGMAARRLVAESYDIERVTDDFLRLYDRLTGADS